MFRRFVLAAAAVALIGAAPVARAASLPPTWDGLVEIKDTKLKAVYLLPGADFHAYDKVMFDPTEVDFVKGWVQHMNNTYTFAEGTTSDNDAKFIAKKVRAGVDKIWSDAFTKAGWQVVTTPGPDVLRVGITVLNLSVSAPFTVTDGTSNIRSLDAGRAEILIQVRDSETGAVLGKAVDANYAGTTDQGVPRSEASNQYDFTRLFDRWANLSVQGLGKLKDLSPVDDNGQPIKK